MKDVRFVKPLGSPPWISADPFLFVVHHDDAYPAGDERMAPVSPLTGRTIGNDFAGKDGWNMYHGDVVPGFPHHPHRGFETVTIVRKGTIDHSDSLGAAARFGAGDTQWLTAGAGIVHAEMFPLLEKEKPNPLELFQIWLNLPSASKLAEPHFSMFWREDVPVLALDGAEVTVVAGRFGDVAPLAPPPHSWAADPASDVAIWTIKLDASAKLALPQGREGTNRMLYVFRGGGLRIGEQAVGGRSAVQVRPDAALVLENGAEETHMLVLQGRPIGEPVAAHGPFVMNSMSEVVKAFDDYQRTQFGGWRWETSGPVHGRGAGRFARFPDGTRQAR